MIIDGFSRGEFQRCRMTGVSLRRDIIFRNGWSRRWSNFRIISRRWNSSTATNSSRMRRFGTLLSNILVLCEVLRSAPKIVLCSRTCSWVSLSIICVGCLKGQFEVGCHGLTILLMHKEQAIFEGGWEECCFGLSWGQWRPLDWYYSVNREDYF